MNTQIEQVGGSHYAATGQQHWDMAEDWDIDYLAGNATAYILRYDRKGTPKEDLLKAKSYLERMILAGRGTKRRVSMSALQTFYRANNVTGVKARLFHLILWRGGLEDVREAAIILGDLAGRLA